MYGNYNNIPIQGSLSVLNADKYSKKYSDIYGGDNTNQIQVYDKNGPVEKEQIFSMEEIQMQWICMASRGRAGRPDHYSYDPSREEWSECNTSTISRLTPVIFILVTILNANI